VAHLDEGIRQRRDRTSAYHRPMATEYEQTERTRIYRKPGRGSYDRELVHSILDEALTCHVGFVQDGQPFVIPTIHARVGEVIYLHGAKGNRMLKALTDGTPCCVTVTLVDELVLARAALHHSLNYRSVMVLGTAGEVTDPAEKEAALHAVVEHIAPGRPEEIRGADETDLKSTRVLSMPIEEASAKVRTGPPIDEEADLQLPHWAGQLPLTQGTGEAVPAPDLAGDPAVPDSIKSWSRT
jgi:nitroimidazol reductase NimA-like FMN-containing flavoprotein (pyridoxamine 5'-phosphate oxidase superfamily)